MEFNPKRNWAVIYSQMWQLAMTDKLYKDFKHFGHKDQYSDKKLHARVSSTSRDDDYCWSFQKTGKCKWGDKCRFTNKCRYCNSLKHGLNSCPKIDKKKRKGKHKDSGDKN